MTLEEEADNLEQKIWRYIEVKNLVQARGPWMTEDEYGTTR